MYYLADTVEDLIDRLPKKGLNEVLSYMSRTAYLKEFRTISLGVPRQSGKTTALTILNKAYSSILLSKVNRVHNVSNQLPNVRGFDNRYGLKYRALFLDEYKEVPDHIYEYIVTDLTHSNMLDKDFFIVNLYTP